MTDQQSHTVRTPEEELIAALRALAALLSEPGTCLLQTPWAAQVAAARERVRLAERALAEVRS